MALAPGVRLGSYEVIALIGEGGMGKVWRAHHAALKRDDALKVLPDAFASDPDRLVRFRREAQVLASLNHPNIAHVYGLEQSDGVQALVMELVDGPTLADRIAQGPIPVDEALPIAKQIAEALEAAHEQGIIHRDLKPANVKVRPDGVVKVLDFGLAKALEPMSASTINATVSPTITSPAMMTAVGVLMGTAAYMSPEQARGKAVDKRSDIWAFGCVLYEMLTGRRAFDGATINESIAAVLNSEPDWDRLPEEKFRAIRRLLERCLRKDRTRRLRDIGDARLEIDEAQTDSPEHAAVVAPRRVRVTRAATVFLLLAAAAIAGWMTRSVPVLPEARLEINTPPTVDWTFAVSPDGLKVVHVTRIDGQKQLSLRPFSTLEARTLPGTEGASLPFWAPDSESVGFFADGKLKRVNLRDGSVQSLAANAPAPNGGAWNQDGTILYAGSTGAPIMRISVGGGEPVVATRFEAQQGSQMFPHFLPDGQHFLFFVSGPREGRGVYVGELDSLDSRRIADVDGQVVYSPTSKNLLFMRGGRLLAQPFDPDALTLRGEAVAIDSNLSAETFLSASAAGPIAYRSPPQDNGQRQLLWVDWNGKELDKALYNDLSALGPALSRDGRHVAVYRLVNANMDIWSFDRQRRNWDRLTANPGDDIYPLWSPDGTRIAFSSRRGSLDLYWKLLSAPLESDELLLSTPQPKFLVDWSTDGKFLLYDSVDERTGVDVWALPLEEPRKPIEVVRTPFDEQHAQFSPDMRWVAYASNRTGRFEVYVRPFREQGREELVSTAGGVQPRWHPSGEELFFIAPDGGMKVVQIGHSLSNGPIELGQERALFPTMVDTIGPNTYRHQFMVAPGGRSLVMNLYSEPSVAPPVVVILNWAGR